MLHRTIALLIVLIATWALAADRSFPHPDRIRYDGQCLTIDGHDTLIFSGAFHYFRCPKELWRDRFTKIKAAGFNCVETYVAWNWHEREQPRDVNDFSRVDLTDLRDWLAMAHDEFGLYTIVRPGPYICAEWAAGGFPMWLTLKRPADTTRDPWLRSDDPTYLAWSKHWMDAVCPVIAQQQVTRRQPGKAGTILVQVENEYDFLGGLTDEQRITHLKSLVRAARSNGIDVPLITCWSRQVRGSKDEDLREVFDGANTYPRWRIEQTAREMEKLRREQPDAPLMIPELQGGWFSNVGGKLSEDQDGITPAQANAITMMALSRGTTILNYYMLFGGTNFGDWAARGNTTSYDYAAAIREHGGVGEKYAVVKSIGAMLHEIGPALARSQTIACESESHPPEIEVSARRATDGRTFLFVWNRSRTQPGKGVLNLRLDGRDPMMAVKYELAPFDFKLLMLPANATGDSDGKWFTPRIDPPAAPPAVPAPVKITSSLHRIERGEADHWESRNGDLASAGVYDAQYVLYRATPTLTVEQVAQFKTLRLELFNADHVLARVNDVVTWPRSEGARTSISVEHLLHEGTNDITLLYENAGYGNFGADTGMPAGLKTGTLLRDDGGGDRLLTQWRVKLIDGERFDPSLAAPDLDDSSWTEFRLDDASVAALNDAPQPGGATDEQARKAARILFDRTGARAAFRCTLELNESELSALRDRPLVFDRIDDDGIVFINGKEVARSRRWDRPCVIEDVGRFLRAGRNVLTVEVHNGDGPGGLTRPVRIEASTSDGLRLDWSLARNLRGVEEKWFANELVEPDKWTNVRFDQQWDVGNPLVQWHRCEFELPKLDAGVWAPWLATIDAGGNGMIYLNGHPLGRWWHVGPQRSFYLPEFWLKFGAGETNVLTLCLRDDGNSPGLIRSMQIGADANFAERR